MDLITILTPLVVGTLLVVIHNQRKAIKRLNLSQRLAQSKVQLLQAAQRFRVE